MSTPQNETLPEITPVILAGGQGTRLRPLTGPSRPKPFLRLFSKYSLLQETLLRVAPFSSSVIILHNSNLREGIEHVFSIRSIREAGESRVKLGGYKSEPHTIIAEPEGRSTAAAIAAAAFALAERDTVMAVMPSDHYIESGAALRAALVQGAGYDGISHIGVRPRAAATRYGYIQARDGAVQRFIEKPPAALARTLVAQGDCFWNTGMFTCRPQFFLDALKAHAPEIYEAVKYAHEQRREDAGVIHPAAAHYKRAPAVAVDYAVMEHIKQGRLVELETGWYDIGCWPSLLRVKWGQINPFEGAGFAEQNI